MYLKVTYDQDFDDLIMHLKSKYPKELFDLDGIGEQTDMSKFSKKFFSADVTADASIDANANVDDISVIAYNTELPKPFFRLNSYYVLWKELKEEYGLLEANEIVEMQLTGDIYIHDFHGVGSAMPYCFNYSTYDIAIKGLPMVKKIKSLPPKHLYAFKSQLEQFTVIASNSTLGATGLADLFIIMSYYVDKILETGKDAHFEFKTEEDIWNYVKENIISFIYTINQPMRANQSPFTNVSVYDDYFLDNMIGDYAFIDGRTLNKETIKKIQELFLNTMNEELKRTPITFPVTTACFSVDENNDIKDEEFLEMISRKNKEFGFINVYIGKTSTLSSCCRLRSESDNEYFNSFGSGSSKIGSLGVCSINLPRMSYQSDGDIGEFYNLLKKYVNIAAKINHAKRNIVQKRIDNGNLPLYTLGYMNINKQYSTVGLNGLNEALEIMDLDILEEKGQEVVLKIMDIINNLNDDNAEEYNSPHNCEMVPGENMSIKMATKDRLMGFNDKYEIYSNQFIPLITKANLLDRVKLQGLFDKHFSGGAIAHLNIDQKIEDESSIEDLIRVAAKKGIVYFAINYNLQRCEQGHMSVGNNKLCSICGEKIVDNFTRVVGFLTNTKNWHRVRREKDYPNREWYDKL
ncbi:MAG: anaerobic ribonucleoside-triphosphate reductase [Eubacteriales bacterium]